MGSVMNKELVGTKDIGGYWSFIFDVSYTEGKNISSEEQFEAVVLENFGDLLYENFCVEDDEIYAFMKKDQQFNTGTECKI
jgi:hypothetical protein